MPRVLVSNNPEILRHLGADNIAALGLDISIAADGRSAMQSLNDDGFDLAILDADTSGISGYEIAKKVKGGSPDCKVVLVISGRIGAAEMRKVTECGCDEVLIAPMGADELYDVVSVVLELTRVGSQVYEVNLVGIRDGEKKRLDGRVISLSVDGARLVTTDEIDDEWSLQIEISIRDEDAVQLDARVVWTQQRDAGTIVAAAFSNVTSSQRDVLARLTEWELVRGGEKTRVVLKGGLTEASNLQGLLPSMVGRVDFDLSQVGYMNSLGAREWVQFLRDAAIRGYEFHACSVPFVLQAGTIRGMLGRGTVASFFAPYSCEGCGHQEDRLLQSAAVLASDSGDAPTFTCPECGDDLELDELPERYLSFLRGEVSSAGA